jgi:hypothetical protein
MRRNRESAADQIWKEKLESRARPWDVIVLLLIFLAVVLGGLLT